MTLMMTSAQVVETSVNVTNNSPSRDYSHPDDQTTQTTETPGFKPFTIIYIYIYDVVKSKRRHWLAVTLSFTPCGDRQTDFYYNEEISLALYTVYLC